MREITATGSTVDEAVESALSQLNISRDRVEVQIIDEGKKGLFGLFGSRPAVVKVTVIPDPIEETLKFLQTVLQNMGIEASIEVRKQDDRQVEFYITGDKMGLLIGKRGQTINSLQYITQLVANRNSNRYIQIILNPENYRERREETLIQLAERMALRVQRLRKPVSLEPMPNYERKIIHTALANHPHVETVSEGEDPHRYVIIKPSL